MSGRRVKIVVAAALCAWGALASSASAEVFRVTRTGDPAPNGCKPRDCSLREAVIAANEAFEQDTIRLADKTYRLTREGDDGLSQVGDLDVLWALRIRGKGPRATTIKGDWGSDPDRLFDVTAPVSFGLTGLTLRGGADVSEGGAIYGAAASTVSTRGVHFVRNRGQYGAVVLYGDGNLTRTVFKRNVGTECCSGVYNLGGLVVLRKTAFIENHAAEDTGAVYNEGTRMIIRDSLFARNTAGTEAGALINDGPNIEISNTTFSGNRADDHGGAIEFSSNSGGQLNNVTMTRNVADADDDGDGDGGAIYSRNSVTVSFRNTIAAGNVDRGGESRECTMLNPPAFVSLGFNLFGNMQGCTFVPAAGDRLGLAPGLKPLRDNGGFTPTHALKRRSRALNRGSDAPVGTGDPTACMRRDQRGVKRPQRGRCDIGAFELKRKRSR